MNDINNDLAAIALIYGIDAAASLAELAATDPAFASRLSQAALTPAVLEEKQRIDKSQRECDAN